MKYSLTYFTDDEKFFEDYPLDSEMKEGIKKLFKERENLERTGLSGLDEKFGYAAIKRNIAYLNNQLKKGYIYYKGEKQIVLVDLETNEIVADEHTPGGDKFWTFFDGRKIRVRPNAWSYYEDGIRAMVMTPVLIEQYFLPKWNRAGGDLEVRKRIIEINLEEPINTSNIFAKENLK